MGSRHHSSRRDSPPGEGDQMDDVDYFTITEVLEVPVLEYDFTFEPTTDDQQGVIDSSSDHSSSSEESGERGWKDLLALDLDNPPVRRPGNATTIGFEFELLVAPAKRDTTFPDPHPNDGRWLSDHLADTGIVGRAGDALSFKYTVRNKIVDELNANGVVTRKTKEYWHDEYAEEFEWWDSLEYENPTQYDQIVLNWTGRYQWNGFETDDDNVDEAAEVLKQQFVQYNKDNNIELYMVTREVIQSVQDRVPFMIQGVAPVEDRRRVQARWFDSVSLLVGNEKQKHYSKSRNYRDPNSVPIIASSSKYAAWSCTDDISIMDPMPAEFEYTIPPGSVPLRPSSYSTYADPPELYRWFGAEVISSVLDYDDPQTPITLRKAAGALRDALRIHKPMPSVRTGVHIHIGQQAGWTLLHLKKFATLWHLIEPSMYKLHRKDRESSIWSVPMAQSCNLARMVFGESGRTVFQAITTGPVRRAYLAQMENYLPPIRRPRLYEFFTNIWQYETIKELNDAMGSGAISQVCIRWRIEGDKLSYETEQGGSIQTLEFRLMQGTLDADHVWKWAGICERLVVFARDSTTNQFRTTIQDLLDGKYPALIGFNQDDIRWFESRQRYDYFTYPDPEGGLDWSDPFMVPGYGDTHHP